MIFKTRSLSYVNIPIRIKIIKGNGRHCGDSSAYFASSSPQIQDQVGSPSNTTEWIFSTKGGVGYPSNAAKEKWQKIQSGKMEKKLALF